MKIKPIHDLTHKYARAKRAERSALDEARLRVLILGATLLIGYSLLMFRLTEVGLSLVQIDYSIDSRNFSFTPQRASMLDRHGEIVATNLTTSSVYANPKDIISVDEVVKKLPEVLPNINPKDLRQKLQNQRSFVWIARNISPSQQAKVLSLGLPGIEFSREEKRVYPHGKLAAHVLGFTDIDNQGLSGLERSQNDKLIDGELPLQLSLDMRVQSLVEEELSLAIKRYKAKAANAIIMEVHTGQIIAMASLPTFDPNLPQKINEKNLFNPNTMGIYDLGSIFKIFTAAMALDSGTTSMNNGYDASSPIRVANFTIGDYRGGEKRWLSVPEIILHSSNIGAAKMAMDVGPKRQKEFYKKLGFLDKAPVELKELGTPQTPQNWKDISTMTISYGYGLGVSPLHVVRGMAALVNGGYLVKPTLLKSDEGITKEQVISRKTSLDNRKLLHLTVARGTAKKAYVQGLFVGAKTGTAEKNKQGRKGFLKDANITSFLGVFPVYDPKYVVFVMLDDPQGISETHGFRAGGWNAAPTGGAIIRKAAPLLKVHAVDEDTPSIRQALSINIPKKPAIRMAGYQRGV